MPVNKLDDTHSRASEMVKDLKCISLEEYLKACEWLIWRKKKQSWLQLYVLSVNSVTIDINLAGRLIDNSHYSVLIQKWMLY